MTEIEEQPEYQGPTPRGLYIPTNAESSTPAETEEAHSLAEILKHCHGGCFSNCGHPLGHAESVWQALKMGGIHRGIEPGTVVIGGAVHTTVDAVTLGFLDEKAAAFMDMRDDRPRPRYVKEVLQAKPEPAPSPQPPSSAAVIAAFLQSQSSFESLFQPQQQAIKS